MTHAEEIIEAVAALVGQGKDPFTRREVRDEIKVGQHEWLYCYTAIFQGMRIDQPGGAPEVGKKFREVFQRVERGKYTLTDHGKRLINQCRSTP